MNEPIITMTALPTRLMAIFSLSLQLLTRSRYCKPSAIIERTSPSRSLFRTWEKVPASTDRNTVFQYANMRMPRIDVAFGHTPLLSSECRPNVLCKSLDSQSGLFAFSDAVLSLSAAKHSRQVIPLRQQLFDCPHVDPKSVVMGK